MVKSRKLTIYLVHFNTCERRLGGYTEDD